MDYLRKFPTDHKDGTFPLYDSSVEEAKLNYFRQQKFPIHYDIESSLRAPQDAFMSWNNNFNLHSFHYANYNRLCGQSKIDVAPQIMKPIVSTFPTNSTFPDNSINGNSIFQHVFPHHYQTEHQQQQQPLVQPEQPVQSQQLHFDCGSPEDAQAMGVHGPKRPRSEKKPVPEPMKDERYREKRAKNNKAAKKSRQERREKEDKNEKELKFLRAELRRLIEEEWRMRIQNHELRTKIAAMRKQLCLADGSANV